MRLVTSPLVTFRYPYNNSPEIILDRKKYETNESRSDNHNTNQRMQCQRIIANTMIEVYEVKNINFTTVTSTQVWRSLTNEIGLVYIYGRSPCVLTPSTRTCARHIQMTSVRVPWHEILH
jgi:hypothetical protein